MARLEDLPPELQVKIAHELIPNRYQPGYNPRKGQVCSLAAFSASWKDVTSTAVEQRLRVATADHATADAAWNQAFDAFFEGNEVDFLPALKEEQARRKYLYNLKALREAVDEIGAEDV